MLQIGYLLPEIVPACVSLHLKKIEYLQFSMLDNEWELVEYILKKARVLDKMIIKAHFKLEMEVEEVWNKLQNFSSYSINCQIVVKLNGGGSF